MTSSMHLSAGEIFRWRKIFSEELPTLINVCSESDLQPSCIWAGLASGDITVWQADAGMYQFDGLGF